ncbi:hypothetical protein GIB67_040717 [Kingdonia uniflora]|uniref:Uncharacterized protein n=1 Tax=Kingdonia uniflora TaxID=39325 RepID=A0A7J7KUC1_9MAGN|nr:hypothetical protein GIB67_040717 [Kingdonia uniflora]
MVVSEGESSMEGSTAIPSSTVPVGWVGGHDHEAGTSVPRDLREESWAEFMLRVRVPGDLAHDDIISGREKGVFESFWPYPNEWRLPDSLADYESSGITMEFLDDVNEQKKARGGSVTLARVSYKSSRLRVFGHKNKECHVLTNILDGKFDPDKYWLASKYSEPRTRPASNTYYVESVHSYKSVESVGMKPRFLNARGKDVSGLNAAAPLVAGLRGVNSHMEDTPIAKLQRSVTVGLLDEDPGQLRGKEKESLSHSFVEEGTRSVGSGKLFGSSLPDGEVQSTPYKEKEKRSLAEALDDPRVRRAAVVAAVRGTLTLEASLLRAENLVSRNADLELRLEEMKATQKELVTEAIYRELADHVASVTVGLEEQLKVVIEEKLVVEGDLEVTHGRLRSPSLEKEANEHVLREELVMAKQVADGLQGRVAELVEGNGRLEEEFHLSTKWWVAMLAPPLLVLRQTRDVPELRHLGYSGRQFPLPLGDAMDITPEEEAQLEDRAAAAQPPE